MRFQCIMCFTIIRLDNQDRPAKLSCPNCRNTLAVPKSRFETGCVIDDFVIESLIGRGGMASVYLARQLSMDRPVALKVLEASYLQEEKHVVAFMREAKAAARINHPNLVTAIAVGEEEGALFYAMEYVKGMTLGEKLEREKTLDCDEALNIAQQCAEALHAAWTREGLIHRDIKPDNIMLADDGYTKIMDLGIAITKQESLAADVSGTPAYMAPEQFTRSALDCRTDMYSLGCTLYAALVGYTPFDGESAQEIARKHLYNEVVFPDRNLVMLPNRAKKLVGRLMAKDPRDRPQSYDELLEEIVFIRKRLAPDESMVPSVHTISFSKYRMREELHATETPSAIFRKRSEKQRKIAIAQRKAVRESRPSASRYLLPLAIIAVLLAIAGGLVAALIYVNQPQESAYAALVAQYLAANPLPLSPDKLSNVGVYQAEDRKLMERMPRQPTAAEELAREKLRSHALQLGEQYATWQRDETERKLRLLKTQSDELKAEREARLSEQAALAERITLLQGQVQDAQALVEEMRRAQESQQQESSRIEAQVRQVAEWEQRLAGWEQQLRAAEDGLRRRARLAAYWQVIDSVRALQLENARRAVGTAATEVAPAWKVQLAAMLDDAERAIRLVHNSGPRLAGTRIGLGVVSRIEGSTVSYTYTENDVIISANTDLTQLPAGDLVALAGAAWPTGQEPASFARASYHLAFCWGDFRLAGKLRQTAMPDASGFDELLLDLCQARVDEIEAYVQAGSLNLAALRARQFASRYSDLPAYRQVQERLVALMRGVLRPPVGSATATP